LRHYQPLVQHKHAIDKNQLCLWWCQRQITDLWLCANNCENVRSSIFNV